MSIPALYSFGLDTQRDIHNSQSHKLSKSKASQDVFYLLLLPSLPGGQEDAPQLERAASSSPGFKGHSSEAEQCPRQPKPAGPGTGWGYRTSVVSLWYPLPGWKRALFLPPSWQYKQQKHWSLFSEGCTRASWCSIWSLTRCKPRNISPQQSQSQQLFPTGISGSPSRLRMLPFPSLPSGKVLVVCTLH